MQEEEMGSTDLLTGSQLENSSLSVLNTVKKDFRSRGQYQNDKCVEERTCV